MAGLARWTWARLQRALGSGRGCSILRAMPEPLSVEVFNASRAYKTPSRATQLVQSRIVGERDVMTDEERDERLVRIEGMLTVLVERQQVRDWYTTQEFGESVGKAEFTIREYCRLGRLRAEKRQSGRGSYPQWVLAHSELDRYRRNGLLPIQRPA